MRNCMKILIDEQLPTKLKYRFIEAGYEAHTVRDMDWLGKKNGDLIKSMIAVGLNVLLTNDKNLYYQQKTDKLKICIVNINCKTNRYSDVVEIIDQIKDKLKEIAPILLDTSGGYFIV
jgi:predicted nuclease of predicted toxin-antitoxin system